MAMILISECLNHHSQAYKYDVKLPCGLDLLAVTRNESRKVKLVGINCVIIT